MLRECGGSGVEFFNRLEGLPVFPTSGHSVFTPKLILVFLPKNGTFVGF